MIIRNEHLVKINSKNRIQHVNLQLDENPLNSTYYIYRITGQFGGKETSHPVITINRGKVTRTVNEQANLQYNSYLKKYLDQGYLILRSLTSVPYSELTESAIKELVGGDYVCDQSGIPKPMLAKSCDQLSPDIFERVWYCSTKIDGVRCLMYYKDGYIHTASRGGGTYDAATQHIRNNPTLNKIFEEHPDLILDGELYKHSAEWPLQKISGIARQETWKDDCENLEYWIYDYISMKPFKIRYEFLMDLQSVLKDEEKIKVIDHVKISGYYKIKNLHDKWVREGFEGLCGRNPEKEYGIGKRSGVYLIKLKEYKDAEFKITGVREGLRPEDMCFTLVTDDNKEFAAKPMGDVKTRIDYLQNKDTYIGKMATCKYFTLSQDGIPTQPILIHIRPNDE